MKKTFMVHYEIQFTMFKLLQQVGLLTMCYTPAIRKTLEPPFTKVG